MKYQQEVTNSSRITSISLTHIARRFITAIDNEWRREWVTVTYLHRAESEKNYQAKCTAPFILSSSSTVRFFPHRYGCLCWWFIRWWKKKNCDYNFHRCMSEKQTTWVRVKKNIISTNDGVSNILSRSMAFSLLKKFLLRREWHLIDLLSLTLVTLWRWTFVHDVSSSFFPSCIYYITCTSISLYWNL